MDPWIIKKIEEEQRKREQQRPQPTIPIYEEPIPMKKPEPSKDSTVIQIQVW